MRTAGKSLEVALNIEISIQNQLKNSETAAYAVSNQFASTSINSNQNPWNRPKSTTNNFMKPTIRPNFGYIWSASHRQNCPTLVKWQIILQNLSKVEDSSEAKSTCNQCR